MNKKHLILLALAANAHVHGAPNLRPRQSKPEPGKNTKHEIQEKTKLIQKTNQMGVAPIDTSRPNRAKQRNAKPQSKEIAATAHVHGADNNESILGKRPHSDPNANNDLAQKQKTDQNSPEQSDISMAEQNVTPRLRTLQQRLTTSGPISVIPQYLTVPEALKMVVLSKDTRKKLESLGLSPAPEKYNNETQQWEKAKVGDNLDECFARCITTVLVPSIPNAIQDLPGIIGNKPVHHIKIVVIDAEPNPYPRPAGWLNMVNDLFKANNNSLTFKVVQPDNTADGWDIENVLSSLTKVKHLIYEGKTGREKIEISIPANVGNHIVTVGNAKRLTVVDRSVTQLERSANARFIIKGNGDLPATITAISGGGLRHTDVLQLSKTETKGRSELTFGYDPIRKRDDTIRANSNGSICHKVFTPARDLEHYEVEVKGKSKLGRSELTVADRIIEASSNAYGRYQNYYRNTPYTRYIAEACGTDNTLKVEPTHDTIKAASDDTVRHKFQLYGGRTIWEGTAKGCKEIKAELSIDEGRKIQLESPIKLLYAYYDECLYPSTPYHSIKTEGRSTITASPSSKIGGTVESDGDILYSKLLDHKNVNLIRPHYQTTHARTNAQLTFGDTDIKGKAKDLIQYTEDHQDKRERHKDTTIHNVLIKGSAEFELKNNPGKRKITLKGDDVDYKNDGDSKHLSPPFSGRSGQCDIILLAEERPEECEFGSCGTNAKQITEYYC